MEDCPDGRMDREKMKVMFAAVMPKVVCGWYDDGDGGCCDDVSPHTDYWWFWWFLQGAAGEQYLDQLFRIFDKDGDGSIDFKVHHYHNHHQYRHHRDFRLDHHHDYQGVHDCNGYEQLRRSCRKTEVNWVNGSSSMVLIIRWAFRMYDKDNSGEIDLDEMVEIFCLMYAIQVWPSSP